jgi:large subunit ribosomal protein L22
MEKEVKAQAKYVKGSPRKARLVVNAVRGLPALQALDVLKYMPKGAAHKVRKVVQSALANATHNDNLAASDLVVSKIMVDSAPMFKRGRAESKGRYRKILKRNSHITVYLAKKGAIKILKNEEQPEAAKAVKAKPAAKPKVVAPKKITKSTKK